MHPRVLSWKFDKKVEVMEQDTIYKAVSDYYTKKITEFGATANGVDWKDAESQQLRFDQLLKLITEDHQGRSQYSLCDWGCGYGALLNHMRNRNIICDYIGYDWSEDMIVQGKRSHDAGFEQFNPQWFSGPDYSVCCDYIIASGIFNVQLENCREAWEKYILNTLENMNKISRIGFSFNMLTSFSDPDKMRKDLYYASPMDFFTKCKTDFSKKVSLLHDYPLYEFTIIVRK